MSKAKKFLVADGETIGLGSRSYLFDFAYSIVTRNETVLERSFLVREILTNPRLMLAAYFSKHWRSMMGAKIFSNYIPAIAAQNMHLHSWREIVETLRDDMQTHNVSVFSAYNLRFDMNAIAVTHRHIGYGDKVLPYKPDLLCLWEFACQTVCNTKLYHDVAHERGNETGWITDAGNVRTNAEKVYAFLSGEFDFIEEHTALADVHAETVILQRLLAKKRAIPYNVLDYMPWRKAQIIGM